jgi:uroporphyrinogen-III decarboxylase
MITGMDRLVAAAKGERTDRVPVFCNLLDQGARELGMSLRDYYARGDLVAEAQLRMRANYGYDNLWGLFYVGKEAELLGCKNIVFAENGPPNVGHLVVKTEADIAKLQVPDDLAAHPAFQEPLKCLRILKQEAGGKYPICAYLTASVTLPAILMGMEKWMRLLLSGPASVRDELLMKCSDFFRKQIAVYRNAGADVLVYSNPFGSTDLVPMRLFQEFSLPWIERDLEPGGTQGVVYYCGGSRMGPVIEQVLSRTGIAVYYLSPMDDIALCKRIVAGRALCAGVINDIRMIHWSEEETRSEVRRIMEAGIPGGRFFFGTLVMPYDIPDRNIRAMLDAAYEYGCLPGGG